MSTEDGIRDEPEGGRPPTAGAHGHSRGLRLPFTGHAEGTFAPVLDGSGHPVPCDAFEGEGMLMRLDGQGVTSHIGAVTLSATHCSSPDPETGQYARGSAIYTATDGDELHAVYEQLGAPHEPALETIVGGTGRFRDASGEVRVRVTPSVEMGEGGRPVFPGRFSATYTGWISCEAANRNG